jgi:vacuolar protein sorting-associated protein 13A/C
MAQKLLLNVLVQVLGEFVEGLSEENLKLGVWSGKIVLSNLELKRASISKLNLPISVIYGSVKKVEINIPWASLESNPVRIEISGVYLLIGPVDIKSLEPSSVSSRAAANKRYKLQQAEKAVELSLQLSESDDKSANQSYFQRLTTKIIGIRLTYL